MIGGFCFVPPASRRVSRGHLARACIGGIITNMPRPTADASARKHLVQLLQGGQAHLDFDAAIKGFPIAFRGKRPKGSPHSPWEILEHMRIAQWDILGFTRDPKHISPDFPSGYWPAKPAPPNKQSWDKSIKAFRSDLKAMIALISSKKTVLHPMKLHYHKPF